ncbi:HAD family hydrolase [Alkalihalobacillus sp. LMS39]|uniref:D-glycero-alpha-D-manno-heptose-1,7-bisphosphate 7-phosphatase n=1 Tax=Alkalihalobacillus sp. LMS39 TaxID=2924032 RepID=UPI001FB49BBE|nr:HAD family hydrolase [Alkalihalobacillus sp. LMS39]UOE92585.1 HAD family hydrolase [Alkalihalobacillus sp. LMS39]
MNKAVFLDRDGVINEVLSHRVKFVNHPKQLYLLEGVPEAIRAFNEVGFKVFIVTNQGGVGLGFMKESMLEKVHHHLKQRLHEQGAIIDDIAYCPHKPQAGCACRKPEAKMIEELAKKHHVSLQDSVMVGDREPDILAGKKAGVATVFIGKEKEDTAKADAVFSSLLQAAPWIIEESWKVERLHNEGNSL